MEKAGHLLRDPTRGRTGRPRTTCGGREELGPELFSTCAENTAGEAWVLLPLAGLLALHASRWSGIKWAALWFVAAVAVSLLCRFLLRRIREVPRARVRPWGRAFVAARGLQGGLWALFPLSVWVQGDPHNNLFLLLVLNAALAFFALSAAVYGPLAFAQTLPLLAVSLVLYAGQDFVPPLPYIVGLLPALFGFAVQIRRTAIRTIRRRLQLQRNQSDLEAANARLAALASTDELTRVGNRRAFLGRAAQELTRADRYERAISVVLVDVDHFKHINDQYGHAVGDEVLRLMTEALTSSLRDTDFVARIGGDEFALLLPETSQYSARQVAERLRRTVSELRFVAEGSPLPVTVSCGVAERVPGRSGVEELLARADGALYRAKREGRNRVASSGS